MRMWIKDGGERMVWIGEEVASSWTTIRPPARLANQNVVGGVPTRELVAGRCEWMRI
jgi:hypothetical protein